MAEFKLGRIRFVWKGAWVTGTTYYKDDVVAFGGKVYICVEGHSSDADFFTDFLATVFFAADDLVFLIVIDKIEWGVIY